METDKDKDKDQNSNLNVGCWFRVGFFKELLPRERSEREWRRRGKFPGFPETVHGHFQRHGLADLLEYYWGKLVQTVARISRQLPVGISSLLN
jgi:hypothetical protein